MPASGGTGGGKTGGSGRGKAADRRGRLKAARQKGLSRLSSTIKRGSRNELPF